jgi:hypothetical protein
MLLGYEFIKMNDINEDNIFKLYIILSKKCLEDEEKLLPGNYYRHDEVNIVDASNAVVDRVLIGKKLPKLMNQLIDYINKIKPMKNLLLLHT